MYDVSQECMICSTIANVCVYMLHIIFFFFLMKYMLHIIVYQSITREYYLKGCVRYLDVF